MKRNILTIGLSLTIIIGCSEDFLDLAPVSQVTTGNFYKSAEDMENALNATYEALHGMYNDMFVFTEVRSDNSRGPLTAVQTQHEFNEFRVTATNSLIEGTWEDHYIGISRANIVLDRIEEVEMDANLKQRFIAEAKFLRALAYFNLVRIWGGVPLVLKETTSVDEGKSHTRASAEEVYAAIINDLEEAKVLPVSHSGGDIGRATRGAAMALLGKVYLAMGDFEAALAELKAVIDLGIYQLLPVFEDVFDPNNDNHAESVFDVQFKGGGGTGSNFQHRFAPLFSAQVVVEVGSGNGDCVPTDEFYNAFENGDLRMDLTVQPGFTLDGEFNAVMFTNKYTLGVPVGVNDASNNWPVIRYSDVLLMYAEALNEQGFQPAGEAFTYLNEVRARAGLPEKSAGNADPDLSVDDQEAFRMAIEQERLIELAFEGHRWFDLVRTGRAIAVMANQGYTVQEHQMIFPIPDSQLLLNSNLEQNPGFTF